MAKRQKQSTTKHKSCSWTVYPIEGTPVKLVAIFRFLEHSIGSLVRYLLRITQDYLWFTLVEEYLPGDADALLAQ